MAANSQRVRRILFGLYALALVTATHWPALAIQSPVFTRLDLLVHAGAFGLWTLLLGAAGFFGLALSRRNIVTTGLVACLYATVDELSQGIPVLRRTVDPLDLAANGAGIVLAVSALALWARVRSRTATAR